MTTNASTMKNITIKVYNTATKTYEVVELTKDGKPTLIKAAKNVNYEFFDHSINRAPNHIIARRQGKDLRVSFERQGQEDDLIIEGFYEIDDQSHSLIGLAEDDGYYYYIPDTGEVADYVTQLENGDAEGHALGGDRMTSPLFIAPSPVGFPWWLAAGLIPLVPRIGKVIPSLPEDVAGGEAHPDAKSSTTVEPIAQTVTDNDKNVQEKSVLLIDPVTGKPSKSVVVVGQGVWSVNPAKEGEVIFTPEPNFSANPTPINYVVTDNTGKVLTAPVAVGYNFQLTSDYKTGETGKPTTINVTSNDDGNIDPTTVRLIDPNNPNNPPATSVTVPNEGTWTVDNEGNVTFTPVEGFTGDPTVIHYTAKDKNGQNMKGEAPITLDYPTLANPDSKGGKPGEPVTQNVTSNDDPSIDPTTIKLIDPNNPSNPPATSVTVPNEGTWTTDGKGNITFEPVDGFTGDPKPIQYVAQDKNGQDIPRTTVDVYPLSASAPIARKNSASGTKAREPVTQNVANNDTDIDPTTIKLIDPATNQPTDTVVVAGQGVWTLKPGTDEVTFTSEPTFAGNPTPITYTGADANGTSIPTPVEVSVTYPKSGPSASDDVVAGTTGQPVTVNVASNDSSNLDPTTIKLIDPNNPSNPPATSVTVPNEGTWTTDGKGNVTFTPNSNFAGDPTPIQYTGSDDNGTPIESPATIAIDYPVVTTPDVAVSKPGESVTQNVISNDDPSIDPTTIKLIDPNNPSNPPATSVTVPNEGTWTTDGKGNITFEPVDGFTGDPTPIQYVGKDGDGNDLPPTSVDVAVIDTPVVTMPDSKPGIKGQPVTQSVINNDTNIDPTTIKLIDPNNPNNPPATSVTVPEGTWTVDNAGNVTFTPVNGLTDDPKPINYIGNKVGSSETSLPTPVSVVYPEIVPTPSSPSINIPNDNPSTPTNPGEPEDNSTPVDKPNTLDPQKPSEPDTTGDATPGHEGNPQGKGDNNVVEGGTTNGTFSITSDEPLQSVTIKGVDITTATPATPVVIPTDKGSLTVTGFNPATGEVNYTYQATPQTHAQGEPVVFDNLPVVATTQNGVSATGSLDIAIVDGVPAAKDDTASVNNTGTATGSVIDNDHYGPDQQGSPAVTPQTNQAGKYGSLTLQADGSYTYTLDKAKLNAAIANGDVITTDDFAYTITDKDGDTATATLKVTVPSTSPSINIPNDNPSTPTNPGEPEDNSTPVDKPNTLDPQKPSEPDTTGDATPGHEGNPQGKGDNNVVEGGTTNGTFSITSDEPLQSVTIKGVDITTATPATPVVIPTDKGSLTVTGFNPATGEVNYTYQATPQTHAQGEPVVFDNLPVVATTQNGVSATGSLDIAIVDGVPAAKDDTASVNNTGTATGSVIDNDHYGPDQQGSPAVTPQTNQAGKYGSLTLQADGSYTYTLDKAKLNAAIANGDVITTDDFSYTITDKDGDTATATLKVTVPSTSPSINIPNDNPSTPTNPGEPEDNSTPVDKPNTLDPQKPSDPDTTGDATPGHEGNPQGKGDNNVVEGGTTNGTFSITSDEPLQSVTIKGVDITTATPATPVVIPTDKGSLTVTGFNPATGEVNYTYQATPQTHAQGEPVVFDNLPVVATTQNGVSATGSLDIAIVDGVPAAKDDTASVNNTGTATGSVIDNDHYGPDQQGSPAVTPQTNQAGKYGSLTLQADGSYTYTLDKAKLNAAIANGDVITTDDFAYTITDKDGDTATATLKVTVPSTSPSINIPNDNPSTPTNPGEPEDNSTPVDKPNTLDPQKPSEPDTTGDATPGHEGNPQGKGDNNVVEGGTTNGTFSITSDEPLQSVTIKGVDITTATPATPVVIPTDKGSLTVTGFNPATGEVNYTYQATPQTHAQGEPVVFDNLPVVATTQNGVSATGSLDIAIVDGVPAAKDDTASVNNTGTATGSVIDNDHYGPDQQGSPAVTPQTNQAGKYGSLTLQADGSYTYTLDKAKLNAAIANGDVITTDDFSYTITDKDGDTATATLKVTVPSTSPSINIPNDNPSTPTNPGEPEDNSTPVDKPNTLDPQKPSDPDTTGDATPGHEGNPQGKGDNNVVEGGTTNGTFSITSDEPLQSVTIKGVDITTATPATPVVIPTDKGSLTVTGFNPATGEVNYTYQATPQTHAQGEPVVFDNLPVVATTQNGVSATGSLDIAIVDGVPAAKDDTASVNNTGTATGSVIDNDHYGPDQQGSPAVTPQTNQAGKYGSLTLQADGSYTYTLDKAKLNAAIANGDVITTDDFAYTITDKDGDTATATLKVTVPSTSPSINIPNDNPSTPTNPGEPEDNSTPVDKPNTLDPQKPSDPDTTGDATPGHEGNPQGKGDNNVVEGGTTNGTFSITSDEPLQSVTIKGVDITTATPATPVVIPTDKGSLTVTGFNPATGEVNYTYQATPQTHAQGEPVVFDNLPVVATTQNGVSATGSLDIAIVDGVPAAKDDTASVNNTGTATGSVIDNDHYGPDQQGSPAVTPQTNQAGKYGSLTLQADGSYTYTLDKAKLNAAIANGDVITTDDFSYTITDKDGDTATATLKVTVPSTSPSINIPNDNPSTPTNPGEPEDNSTPVDKPNTLDPQKPSEPDTTGDATPGHEGNPQGKGDNNVVEGGTTNGTFSITSDEPLQSVTIKGVDITTATPATPVVIPTDKGSLTVTGFNPATGEVNYTYQATPQTHAQGEPVVFDNLPVVATTQNGVSATGSLDIAIVDGVPAAKDDTASVNNTGTATGSVIDNDHYGPDQQGSPAVTPQTNQAGKYGSLTLQADGSYTYTLDKAKLNAAIANGDVITTDDFSYTITDKDGDTATATLKVTVPSTSPSINIPNDNPSTPTNPGEPEDNSTPVDKPNTLDPQKPSEPDTTGDATPGHEGNPQGKGDNNVVEGGTTNGTFSITSDEPLQSVTIKGVDITTATPATPVVIPTDKGSLTVTGFNPATGEVNYTYQATPQTHAQGEPVVFDNLPVVATTQNGVSATGSLDIAIVDGVPAAKDDTASVNNTGTATGSVIDNDHYGPDQQGSPAVTPQTNQAGKYGSLTLQADGSYTYTLDKAKLNAAIANGDVITTDDFSYTITDKDGDTATATLKVTVPSTSPSINIPNDNPSTPTNPGEPEDNSTPVDKPNTLDPQKPSDPDTTGDATPGHEGNPQGKGDNNVVEGGTTNGTFSITSDEPLQSVTIKGVDITTATPATPVVIPTDKGSLTVTGFNPATGEVNYTYQATPQTHAQGEPVVFDNLPVVATTQNGVSATGSLDIAIVDGVPAAKDDTASVNNTGTATGSVIDNDHYGPDQQGSPAVTPQTNQAGKYGSLTLQADGSYTYTLDKAKLNAAIANGDVITTDDFSYTITDKDGDTATATLKVTVPSTSPSINIPNDNPSTPTNPGEPEDNSTPVDKPNTLDPQKPSDPDTTGDATPGHEGNPQGKGDNNVVEGGTTNGTFSITSDEPLQSVTIKGVDITTATPATPVVIPTDKGSLTVTGFNPATGEVNYTYQATPQTHAQGEPVVFDNLPVVATTQNGVSATGSLDIAIVDGVPAAKDDTASVNNTGTATGSVIDNDHYGPDQQGSPAVTPQTNQAGKYGSLTLQADGSYTYTLDKAKLNAAIANGDVITTDDFSYTITDKDGDTATATLKVTVPSTSPSINIPNDNPSTPTNPGEPEDNSTPVDKPNTLDPQKPSDPDTTGDATPGHEGNPQGKGDNNVVEGGTTNGTFSITSDEPLQSVTIKGVDITTATPATPVVIPTDKGSLTVTGFNPATGEVNYTYQATPQTHAQGEPVVFDNLPVVATTQNGVSATGSLDIAIVDGVPAAKDDTASVNNTGTATGSVIDNDHYGPDQQGSPAVTPQTNQAGKYGSLTLQADGSYTYTLDKAKLNAAIANGDVITTDDFSYTITDKDGDTATATLKVTVPSTSPSINIPNDNPSTPTNPGEPEDNSTPVDKPNTLDPQKPSDPDTTGDATPGHEGNPQGKGDNNVVEGGTTNGTFSITSDEPLQSVTIKGVDITTATPATPVVIPTDKGSLTVTGFNPATGEVNYTYQATPQTHAQGEPVVFDNLPVVATTQNGVSATGSLDIAIVDGVPAAKDDTASVNNTGTATGSVIDNDHYGPDQQGSPAVTPQTNQAGKYGSLTLQADGSYTYTLDKAKLNAAIANGDVITTDDFAYTITDKDGDTATATLKVTVPSTSPSINIPNDNPSTPTNPGEPEDNSTPVDKPNTLDPQKPSEPDTTGDATPGHEGNPQGKGDNNVVEGGTTNGTFSITSDEPLQSVTIKGVDITTATPATPVVIPTDKGSLTVTGFNPATGEVNYTYQATPQTHAQGEPVVFDNLPVVATTQNGVSATGSLDIAIVDGVPAAKDDTASVNNTGTATGSVIDNDHYGPDQQGSPAVTPQTNQAGKYGSLTLQADGSYTYTLDKAKLNAAIANGDVITTDDFSYTITDKDGDTATATLKVTVPSTSPSINIPNDNPSTPTNPGEPEDNSTPVDKPNTLDPQKPSDPDTTGDATPGHEGNPQGKGDNNVVEGGTTNGTFSITSDEPLQSVTIKGVDITTATPATPVVIPTDKGSLTVTGFNPATGEVNYTYQATPQTHAQGEPVVFDNLPVVATTQNGVSATGSLDIAIVDGVPAAKDDTASVNNTGTATGSVIDNDHYGPDQQGSPAVTPQTNQAGKYGSLTLQADGSYTYTLDKAKLNAAIANGDVITTDDFAYTITDKDGDTATATLKVTVPSTSPSINIPNDNPSTPTNPGEPEDNSTPVDKPNTLDPQKPSDPDTTGDATPGHEGNPQGKGDNNVVEGGTTNGTFSITSDEPLQSVTIKGVDITTATPATPVVIPTDKGSLTVTGFNPATGEVNYTYQATPQTHAQGEPVVFDNLPVVATTQNGVSATGSLDIAIVDGVPAAKDDTASVNNTGTATGSVIDNDHYGPDQQGSPAVTPQTNQAGKYGSLTLQADGSYTYTLDKAKLNAAIANGDVITTDDFSYTITDKDGDTATATLKVTVPSTSPSINIPNDNPSTPTNPGEPEDNSTPVDKPNTLDPQKPSDPDTTGDATPGHEGNPQGKGDNNVVEGGTTNGTFSITSDEPLQSVTIKGVDITTATPATPVVIPTDKGSLTVTGFNPATGEVNYTYQATPQTHAQGEPVVFDNLPVVATTQNGVSATGSLDIAIVDGVPAAKDDTASVNNTGTATGSVIDNDHYGPDQQGSPAVTPQTNQAGKYGSLTLQADGSYTYTLDKAKLNAAIANGDVITTDDFSYTITDKDGDTATATLKVTVPSTSPSINIPNDNPSTPTNPGEPEDNSTPVDKPNTLDPQKPSDPDTTGDATPGHEGNPQGKGDNNVVEGGTTNGTFSITSDEPLQSVTIKGVDITTATPATPVVIPTDKGSLTVTGFNPATGEVNYTYQATPQTHAQGEPVVFDNLPVVATTQNGVSATGSLDIAIVDGVPAAKDDTASVNNTGTATGSVIDNDHYGPDQQGSPAVTPQTNQAGKYGSLTLQADGSYTYTLDKAKLNAAIANGDVITTDDFSYTITDKDGDTATATLKVTVPNELPKVSIAENKTMNEIDGNTVSHTISLEKPATAPVVVKFKVEPTGVAGDKPATYGDDYVLEAPAGANIVVDTAGNGTVTFETGDQTMNLNVKVKGDNVYEGKETFKIVLEQPTDNSYLVDETKEAVTNAIFDDGTTDGTTPATDNDKPALSVSSGTFQEAAPTPTNSATSVGYARFDLTLNKVSELPIKLSLTTGTAKDGQPADTAEKGTDKDYLERYEVSFDNGATWETVANGELVIPANTDATKTPILVRVPLVDDNSPEPQEKFTLMVTEKDTSVLQSPTAFAEAVITDNDKSSINTPTPDPRDPANSVAGANTVEEGAGDANPVTGTMTITEPAGVQTLTVGGQNILTASPSTPVVINGAEGTLTVTNYNPATGEISYSYVEDGEDNNHTNGRIFDAFEVKLTDQAGQSDTQNLVIEIADTTPTAVNDADQVDKVSNVTSVGNVIEGTGGNIGTANLVADNPKDNATLTQVNGIKVDENGLDTEIVGTYGKLIIKKDGSYRYELDKNDPETQALGAGEEANEVFDYTLTDQDGDTANANLTIKVIGSTDNTPPVANDDIKSGEQGQIIAGNIINDDTYPQGKDTDVDNDTLRVTGFTVDGKTGTVGTPLIIDGKGTITIAENGSYTFEPLPDFSGEVPPINYTITDGKAEASADLKLSIEPKLTVDVTGTPSVNEENGLAEYTFKLRDDVKAPAGGVLVTYVIEADAEHNNPAESADIVGGFKEGTILIPAGQNDVVLPINIADDDKYEGKEGFKVSIQRLDKGEIGTATAKTEINDTEDTLDIELDPPAHVSEEGLTNAKGEVIGNQDNSSAEHKDNTTVTETTAGNEKYDVTNSTVTNGKVRVKNAQSTDSKTIENLVVSLDAANTTITANGKALKWESQNTDTHTIWTAVDDTNKAYVKVTLDKTGRANGADLEFAYTAELLASIDHPTKAVELAGEDNLPIAFNVSVTDKNNTAAKITESQTVVVVEDDAPIAIEAVHVVDVPVDDVVVSNVRTGFRQPDEVDMSAPNAVTPIEHEGNATIDSTIANNPNFGNFEELNWSTSYTLSNDAVRGGAGFVKATQIDQEIDLVKFTHLNKAASGRLYEATLDFAYDVEVNGIITKVEKAVTVHHVETYNTDFKGSGGTRVLLSDNGLPVTGDDFIVFEVPDEAILIDGKRYELQMSHKPDDGRYEDSFANYQSLKATYDRTKNDGLGFLEFIASNGGTGTPRYIEAKEAYDRVEAEMKKVVDLLTANEDDIRNGKLLVLRTPEPQTNTGENKNGFSLKAKLALLDEPPVIDNNLEISGKLKKGSELPGQVEWTTTDSDVRNPNASEDTNGNKVFESKYGRFTANKDGSYHFVAAKDIAKQVDLSNQDEKLEFSYIYTDQDGDTANNKVIINLNDYKQSANARVMTESDAKDTNDSLKGTSRADTLLGGEGDDTLEGLAGADRLDGGAGNDYFLPSFRTDASGNIIEDTIIGGLGYDTLVLNPQHYSNGTKLDLNGNFNASTFVGKVSDIEAIDITNNIAQTLTIKASDVLSITDADNTLFIKGDSSDTVDIDKATWQKGTSDQEGFDVYTSGSATLYIDTDITNVL